MGTGCHLWTASIMHQQALPGTTGQHHAVAPLDIEHQQGRGHQWQGTGHPSQEQHSPLGSGHHYGAPGTVNTQRQTPVGTGYQQEADTTAPEDSRQWAPLVTTNQWALGTSGYGAVACTISSRHHQAPCLLDTEVAAGNIAPGSIRHLLALGMDSIRHRY